MCMTRRVSTVREKKEQAVDHRLRNTYRGSSLAVIEIPAEPLGCALNPNELVAKRQTATLTDTYVAAACRKA